MPREPLKLRMQEPRVYDFTDDRAVTLQMSQLDAIRKKKYWRGVEDASLPASGITAISLFFTWVTSEKYRDFFLSGAAWEAFFVGVTIFFTGTFFVLLVRRFQKRSHLQHSIFEDAVSREDTGHNVPALLAPQSSAMDQKSDKQLFKGVRKK